MSHKAYNSFYPFYHEIRRIHAAIQLFISCCLKQHDYSTPYSSLNVHWLSWCKINNDVENKMSGFVYQTLCKDIWRFGLFNCDSDCLLITTAANVRNANLLLSLLYERILTSVHHEWQHWITHYVVPLCGHRHTFFTLISNIMLIRPRKHNFRSEGRCPSNERLPMMLKPHSVDQCTLDNQIW